MNKHFENIIECSLEYLLDRYECEDEREFKIIIPLKVNSEDNIEDEVGNHISSLCHEMCEYVLKNAMYDVEVLFEEYEIYASLFMSLRDYYEVNYLEYDVEVISNE